MHNTITYACSRFLALPYVITVQQLNGTALTQEQRSTRNLTRCGRLPTLRSVFELVTQLLFYKLRRQ